MAFALGSLNAFKTATASGGSWLAGAPASSAGTDDWEDTARSTNVLTTSTKILYDHGSSINLDWVYVPKHNCTSAGTFKVSRGTTTTANETHAGTFISMFPASAYLLDFNGKYHGSLYVFPATTAGRYTLVEFSDTANPAGYLDIKLFTPTRIIYPRLNPDYGLKDTPYDLSSVSGSDYGAKFGERRGVLRKTSFVLGELTLAENIRMYELMRTEGKLGRVQYIPDTADLALSQYWGFLGTLDEMSDSEYPSYNRRKIGFKMTEFRG